MIYQVLFVPHEKVWINMDCFTAKNVETFLKLLYPQNTILYEEIRKELSYFVSEGMLKAENTETARIYSVITINVKKMATPKVVTPVETVKVSLTEMATQVANAGGRIVTIKFIKKDTEEVRTANGRFCGMTPLGNIQFQENKYLRAKKAGTLAKHTDYHEYTQFLPKNLVEVRVGKKVYVSNKAKAKKD